MGNAPTTGDDETDDEWTPTSTSNAGWRTRARGWVTRACLVVASAVFALYVVGLVVPDEEEDGAREGDGGGGGGGGGGARGRVSSDDEDAVGEETMPTSARVKYVPRAKRAR